MRDSRSKITLKIQIQSTPLTMLFQPSMKKSTDSSDLDMSINGNSDTSYSFSDLEVTSSISEISSETEESIVVPGLDSFSSSM